MKPVKAVYAGTFDPVTNGHIDIIDRASQMFEVLYVTILDNINKNKMFTLEERLALLKETTQKYDNVIVTSSNKLAVEYAREVGAKVLVRGLRATTDFEYELQMALANQHLADDIDMVFLMTRARHSFISSSTVKEIASHHHTVDDLAPSCVAEALKKKIG